MSEYKPVVINLFGAPGSGKTTVANGVFEKMKWMGFNIENVSEYAKELVFENRMETMKNEIYIFAKQHQRMFRLREYDGFIVTDRPILLSAYYDRKYGHGSENQRNVIIEEHNRFDNINIFLNRTKKYNPVGRVQTEEEAIEIAVEMKEMLTDLGIEYIELDGTNKTKHRIVELLIEKGIISTT